MTDYEIIGQSNALYLDACVLAKIDLEPADEDARFTRILVHLSRIPVFYSFVGIGEVFRVAGKKKQQGHIGIPAYLFSCRALMNDAAQRKWQRVEPVDDKRRFIQLAERRVEKYSSLGGGDIWHLMAALNLQRKHDALVVFSFDKKLVKAVQSEKLRAVCGVKLDPDKLADELKRNGKLVGKTGAASILAKR